MRLTDITDKIKEIPDVPRDIFIFIFVGLISLSGYLTWNIASGNTETEPHIQILSQSAAVSNAIAEASSTPAVSEAGEKTGKYVGSRSGHSYYLPTCSGVKRIKDANKVWFQSAEEAKGKGYKPATTCKGLQ